MWYHSPFAENVQMNPVKYRNKFSEGENLVSTIMTELSIPVTLSIHTTYSECLQPGVCLCRRRLMVWYRYRKC